jgi:hypothetical protein
LGSAGTPPSPRQQSWSWDNKFPTLIPSCRIASKSAHGHPGTHPRELTSRTSTCPQTQHRATTPGASMYKWASATAVLLRGAYIVPAERSHPWQILCLIHPPQRCRQDMQYASSFPFSRRAKTLRPDLVAIVAGGSKEVRYSFHEWCRTADITSRAKICGPSCVCDQYGIEAARWSRPILRNSSCVRDRHAVALASQAKSGPCAGQCSHERGRQTDGVLHLSVRHPSADHCERWDRGNAGESLRRLFRTVTRGNDLLVQHLRLRVHDSQTTQELGVQRDDDR